jgi:hypothetical protein
LYFFPRKLLLSSQKYRLRIRDPEKKPVPGSTVADPDPGSGAFLTPGFESGITGKTKIQTRIPDPIRDEHPGPYF